MQLKLTMANDPGEGCANNTAEEIPPATCLHRAAARSASTVLMQCKSITGLVAGPDPAGQSCANCPPAAASALAFVGPALLLGLRSVLARLALAGLVSDLSSGRCLLAFLWCSWS